MSGYGGADAPPIHGEDKEEIAEIEGVSGDVYSDLSKKRTTDRKAREVAEDRKGDAKPTFIQPQKEKRFKIYMKYEGRKGPPAWIKARLPKHGGFEDGSAMAIKKMFCGFYNRLRELVSIHSCHLRSETGIAIPDEDAISGYIGYGGLIYIVDGSAPAKMPEHQVYFWGANSWSDPKGETPSPVLTLSRKRICQVSVGKEFAMALTEGGRLFSWGKNDFGQLGTGDEEMRALPVYSELPYETYISSIACGSDFSMGLTKKGDLWSWGRFQASNYPRLFADTWCNGYEAKGEQGIKGLKITRIDCGDQHMAALTKEGKLYTWGYNDFGQLGWGKHGEGLCGQQKPQQVKGLVENEEIIDFACGGGHTVSITKSCRIFAWGCNTNGQLGHALKQCFPEPVEIPLGDPIAKVRAGWQCTAYVTESARPIICGGVRAAGPSIEDCQATGADGAAPEAGGGPQKDAAVMDMVSTTGIEVMTEVVTEAAVAEAHGLLICYDGTVRGWGYNRQKQAIGDESDDTFVKPQPVDDMPEGWKGHSLACGGAASYAIMKPPGQ